ncbi:sensor histidine kinase [Nonomuraea sp. K274]|uniref:histidine kinase n=1 Tax=Nonomuraea cypriaca TaxID=1187855 RepID=A0A931ACM5_9ACTN|nr:sensor histidine kinase [Nonomuraea cypriaca]MBF8186827.1 sensor histidine kinase [Nonomuraea cypriaca]
MHGRERWARVAADAGLGVVFAVVLAFWAARIAASWGGGYWWFDCAAGAVVCGIALVRRRGPLPAAVAGLAVAAVAIGVARFAGLPAEPGPAMASALSVLTGSAVRVLPVLPACAVAGGGLAVAAGSLVFAGPAVAYLNGAGWLAALACGLCPRLLVARRRAVAERVRRHQRLDLARDLHDVVAHHITSVVLQAQAARLIARKDPEQAADSLAGIEAAGAEALAATRHVVGLLRTAGQDAADPLGPERLSDLVERFPGPPVRLRLPDGELRWRPDVAGMVYRVVQESLTNVSRHAGDARSVTVTITQDRDAVAVEVVDDAPPARHPRRGGYGLLGMRERVEALGGTLHAGPRPGTGWSVHATLPTPGPIPGPATGPIPGPATGPTSEPTTGLALGSTQAPEPKPAAR